MDLADYRHPAGTIPTTCGGPPRYIHENEADSLTNRGPSDWIYLTKSDFKHAIGTIFRVLVAALAYGRRDNIKTDLGDIVIKHRYVIPVFLHEQHMDVLIMSTSSGSGGGMLWDGKKDSCVGFTKESIQDYINPFPIFRYVSRRTANTSNQGRMARCHIYVSHFVRQPCRGD
jgi:hypothetical protein